MRRKHKPAFIDFETRSLHPLNVKPDDLVAVYYEEAGMIKRVDIDQPVQLEFKSIVAEHAEQASKSPFDYSWHDELERGTFSETGRTLADTHYGEYAKAGSGYHKLIEDACRQPYDFRFDLGDQLVGGVHTSTNMDYAELETRLMAWWHEQWEKEFLRACYGVQKKPLDNSVIPCSKGAECNWPACPQDCVGRPGNITG